MFYVLEKYIQGHPLIPKACADSAWGTEMQG